MLQGTNSASIKAQLASEQFQNQAFYESLAHPLQPTPWSNRQDCSEVQKVLETGQLATVDLAFQAPLGFAQHPPQLLSELQDERAAEALVFVTRHLVDLKQKEDDLQQRKECFQQLFNNGSIAMGIASSHGRFLMANQQLCEMMGYSREELLNLTFWDISHPADHDEEFELLENALQQVENMMMVEKRYIRKDKTAIWVKITVSLITNQAGELQYQIGTVEKISDRNPLNLD